LRAIILVASRDRIKVKRTLAIFFFLCPAFLAAAQDPSATRPGAPAGQGKYIVDQVAMCAECHTPRDSNGRLRRAEYLKGAPVPVKAPPYSQMKWALKAPAIAGLPGYSREQAIRLLMEGITADGRTPDPPMPRFRFTRSDAEAVVAYLKSLQ
jgi:mono/diheme cytochrome c family protein